MALPTSTADVVAAINWCRKHGVPMAARGGGHSYGGYCTTEGLLLNLKNMNRVEFDRRRGTVRVGPGARNIDVAAALMPYGVTTPSGRCPTVGISGLTLGGGLGFTARKFGLFCDGMVSTEVVTAAGERITCTPTNAPDLFWACQGGGGGNFGINTGFEFAVHPVGDVAFASAEWEWPDAVEVFDTLQRIALDAPADFSCRWGFRGWGPQQPQSEATRRIEFLGLHFGSRAQLEELLSPAIHAIRPVTAEFERMSFWEARNLLGTDVPYGAWETKSSFVSDRISQRGIETIMEWVERIPPTTIPGGSSISMFNWLGGAVNRVRPSATAFVHRNNFLMIEVETSWLPGDPLAVVRENLAWVRSARAALRPYVPDSSYQNFTDRSQKDWRSAWYGANYPRLREVKRKYDPHDFFRFEQGIQPA